MRSGTFLFALMLASESAIALDTNDDARAWGRASADDKARWVGAAVASVNSSSPYKYTIGSVAACLDAQSKAPASRKAPPLTLGTATALCMIRIERGFNPGPTVKPPRQV
jgi:hypothetical protein